MGDLLLALVDQCLPCNDRVDLVLVVRTHLVHVAVLVNREGDLVLDVFELLHDSCLLELVVLHGLLELGLILVQLTQVVLVLELA